MARHYRAEAYFEGEALGYSSYGRQERSLRATFRRLLRQLERRGLVGGSVLEVGCGYGYFLDEAAGFFRDRVGTEMSPGAARAARRFADRVYVGDLDALPASEKVDLIVALHVIEHVYEPLTFVRSLLTHVQEGGYVLLATPDFGSLWRRLLGRAWPSFKYPEHVVFYDRDALGQLLSGFDGLHEAQAVPYPHAFPLSEVLRKLGLPSPSTFDRLNVWIPGTTVALACRYGSG